MAIKNSKEHKYFIQEHLHSENFHGGIGSVDIEKILLRIGYTALEFPGHFDFSLAGKFKRMLYLLKLALFLPRGSIVFFQFPLYARMHKLLLKLLTRRNTVHIICMLTDINGLKEGDAVLLNEEIKTLQSFRYFIVHNENMNRWLKNVVPHAQSAVLHFFDFLANPSVVERHVSNDIVFAGNLSKSLFLEHTDEIHQVNELRFNVYGPGITHPMETQLHLHYKGTYAPYALPEMIEGSFGLVWDGDGIEAPMGSFGDYMQYICHHKLSLYMVSGLPVIVYNKAGSAEMVRKNKLGITINNLNEIAQKLNMLEEEEYRLMCSNTKAVATSISSGHNLQKALDELYGMIRRG